jgi:hypothetical protein
MDDFLQSFDSGVDLIKSMARIRCNPSQEGKLRFFGELKAARLLVPCREADNSIAVLNTPEKEAFLPGFTSADELGKWKFPMEKVSVMLLDALKHIVIDNPTQLTGVVINPFGQALFLRQPQFAEMDSLTEGMTLARTDHKGKLEMKATTDYPVGLPKALSAMFEGRSEVFRAWILLAREGGDAKFHKLFVIDFNGDRKQLFPSVAKTVEKFMRPGESFELMKANAGLVLAAQAKSAPVYVKTGRADT